MRGDKEFRVYISSTVDDLLNERAAAREVISHYARVLDSYRASEEGTVETCTKDVREAHVYVGILGQRYGWTGNDGGPDAKSITELEYEACVNEGRPSIPRLMFLRTVSPDHFRDYPRDMTKAARIEAFRQRAAQEQQPFNFATIAELREQLREAVRTKRDEFFRADAPAHALFEQRKVWRSALTQIGLFCVPGSDERIRNQLTSARPELFSHAELDPAAPDLAVKLDEGLRGAQLGCVLLTTSSLARLTDESRRGRLAHCFELIRRLRTFLRRQCDSRDLAARLGRLPPGPFGRTSGSG